MLNSGLCNLLVERWNSSRDGTRRLVCSGLVGMAINYTIRHGLLANGYGLTISSKVCLHKMTGQLGSYMVGEPMPMANIHSVFW